MYFSKVCLSKVYFCVSSKLCESFVATHAFFPQIFLDRKAESADFFTFRMYVIVKHLYMFIISFSCGNNFEECWN